MHKQLWGYKVEKKLYVGVREQKNVQYRCCILHICFLVQSDDDLFIKLKHVLWLLH
jgi:hypothetical protein